VNDRELHEPILKLPNGLKEYEWHDGNYRNTEGENELLVQYKTNYHYPAMRYFNLVFKSECGSM